MWEPQSLTALQASMDCYSFTALPFSLSSNNTVIFAIYFCKPVMNIEGKRLLNCNKVQDYGLVEDDAG
jgi:hypothetical protein